MRNISALFIATLLILLNVYEYRSRDDSREIASDKSELTSSEWTSIFQDRVRTFSCGYAGQILIDLKERGSDIDNDIQVELAWLDAVLSSKDLNRFERQLIKSQKRVLKDLQKTNKRNEKVQQFYESFCDVTQDAIGGMARGSAHILHATGLVATFPLRFLYAFGRGLAKGDVGTEKRLSLYEIIGSQQYRSIATYALYEGARLMILGSTSAALWTIPVFAVPFSDLLVSQICDNPNMSNEREVKFCTNYKRWGNPFLKGVVAGEKSGAKINKLFKRHKEDYLDSDDKVEVSDDNLCSMLQSQKRQPKGQWNRALDMLGLMVNPKRFAPVAQMEAITSLKDLSEMPHELIGKLRNVIVTLGPSEADMAIYRDNDERSTYRDIQKNILKMKKQLRHLYRAKDEATCLKRKKKNNFEWDRYKELLKKKNEMRRADLVQQDQMSQKLIKRARGILNRSLHLDWEVIPTNDIKVIHDLLRSPDVGNLVIITHAFDNGKLVDAQMTTIPNRFFAEISPSIMSLTFYACHGPNIVDAFYLNNKFFGIPSYHIQKHIFSVGPNEVMGQKDVSPLIALAEYLERLDQIVFRSMKSNLLIQTLSFNKLPETIPAERCLIDIGSAEIKSGTLAVIVNRRYVGSIRSGEAQRSFDFPCTHLDRVENIVLLHNIHATEKLVLSEQSIDIKISHPHANYRVSKVEPVYVEGLFSSEKITVVTSSL